MSSSSSFRYKGDLAPRPVFVLLVVSRGGHVIWGVKIQRWSYPDTRLCIVKVETRHHLRHLDTKAVLRQDSSSYCWWFHVEITWFKALKYKDGLIRRAIFVCFVVTRGGPLMFNVVVIQRRSLLRPVVVSEMVSHGRHVLVTFFYFGVPYHFFARNYDTITLKLAP